MPKIPCSLPDKTGKEVTYKETEPKINKRDIGKFNLFIGEISFDFIQKLPKTDIVKEIIKRGSTLICLLHNLLALTRFQSFFFLILSRSNHQRYRIYLKPCREYHPGFDGISPRSVTVWMNGRYFDNYFFAMNTKLQ